MRPMLRSYGFMLGTVIAVSAVFRALLSVSFGPGPDEAYYWTWSTRLDWGYVDHPPMVAYLLWLIRALGGEAPWAWRCGANVLSCAGSALIYLTGRELFNKRAGFWAAVAFTASPFYGTTAGIMLLPESILIFWTALALYLAAKLIATNNLKFFYALGAVFGAGMLSNPPALLIPTGLVLFGLLSKPHRFWFARKEPYIGVSIALILLLPLMWWNWQQDFIGVGFLVDRTQLTESTGPPGLGLLWQTLFFQAVYHTPVVFCMLCIGLAIGVRRAITRADARFLLLTCFSFPLLIVFLIVASSRATLPHWPASAYLAAYLALPGIVFHEQFCWTATKKMLTGAALGTAVLFSAVLPLLLVYPLTSLVFDRLQHYVSLPPEAAEPMAQMTGWGEEIRTALMDTRDRIASEEGQPPVFLTHFNVLAGLLSYHLQPLEVVSIHAQARQFDMWYDDHDLIDKPVLFISAEIFDAASAGTGKPEDYYSFDHCDALPAIEVVRHGQLINRVHLWLCHGYNGPADQS